MEVVGGAAALAELLGVSVKVCKAAKSLVRSFLNAPEELLHLTSKLDRLYLSIKQLHSLGEELPESASFVLLPPEHQTTLSGTLQANFEAIQTIQDLCDSHSGKARTVEKRLRWATFDKKKAGRILRKVAKAESDLNTVLTILGLYKPLILIAPCHIFRSCVVTDKLVDA